MKTAIFKPMPVIRDKGKRHLYRVYVISVIQAGQKEICNEMQVPASVIDWRFSFIQGRTHVRSLRRMFRNQFN